MHVWFWILGAPTPTYQWLTNKITIRYNQLQWQNIYLTQHLVVFFHWVKSLNVRKREDTTQTLSTDDSAPVSAAVEPPDGADDGGHGEPPLAAVAAGEGGAVPRHQLGLRQPRRELPELPHAEVVRGQGGVSGADLDVGTFLLDILRNPT